MYSSCSSSGARIAPRIAAVHLRLMLTSQGILAIPWSSSITSGRPEHLSFLVLHASQLGGCFPALPWTGLLALLADREGPDAGGSEPDPSLSFVETNGSARDGVATSWPE